MTADKPTDEEEDKQLPPAKSPQTGSQFDDDGDDDGDKGRVDMVTRLKLFLRGFGGRNDEDD